MNRYEIVDIAHAMIQYGGSFAKHIGEALLHADPINMEKLLNAFPEMIKEYERFL